METKANIIKKYAASKPEVKVEIICKYYPMIDGIINARIAGMKYIIAEEKEKSRRESHGELGVRVQCGSGYSDPTGDEGTFRADLDTAIRKCSFPEDMLEGISNPERIIREALILKEMKEIKNLYDMQIACLAGEDRGIFQKYLNREMNITDIASSCGIGYRSAVKRMTKIRKYIGQEVVEIINVTSCHVGTI